MKDVSEIPIANEDTIFVAQERARIAALREAQEASDDEGRFEALLVANHFWQLQIPRLTGLLKESGERSTYDPDFPEFSAWMNVWMEQDFTASANLQNNLLEVLGEERAQEIADGRATPRIQRVIEDTKAELEREIRQMESTSEPQLKPEVAAEANDVKVCPDCAETIKAAARVCRYCGFRFESEIPN